MLISTDLGWCHNSSQPMRAFGVGLRQQRSALAQHSGVHLFDNFVVYDFESFRMR